jgi:hypothetical protein
MGARQASARGPRLGGAAHTAAVALAIAVFLFHPAARAQCGASRSTCSSCHDEAHATFSRSAAFHSEHAFADLCVACHGGNGEAAGAEAAHLGLAAPLAAEGERCRSCHAEKLDEPLSRYRTEASKAPSPGLPPPATIAAVHGTSKESHRGDLVAGLAACVLAIGLAITAWRREAFVRELASRWRSPTWSPYLGGVLLGVLVAVSTSLLGHRLSGAGAYQNLSGLVGRHVAPTSFYWRHVMPTGFTWDVAVAVGALAGAFVSSRMSRSFAIRTMPDSGWEEVFGKSVVVRWVVAFGGSMLTEIGAGIAGGCTASLAVSGGAVLAPSAYLFMAGMFAGGIPAIAIVTALSRRIRR